MFLKLEIYSVLDNILIGGGGGKVCFKTFSDTMLNVVCALKLFCIAVDVKWKLKRSLKVVLWYTIADRSINLPDTQGFESMSETERTVIVANHLLGKLGTSSCFMIDKNFGGRKQENCFCGEQSCKMTGEYGDTTIGKGKYLAGSFKKYVCSNTFNLNYMY